MAFVSITRLRIRSMRFMPLFLVDTFRAQAQVARAEGFLGGRLLADRRFTFWTMTLWRDAACMRRYMTGGAHLKAMPKLIDWCDEASIVHWEGMTLPSWQEADARMRSDGRPSKVRHPSAQHADLSFAPPRITRGGRIRPKRS